MRLISRRCTSRQRVHGRAASIPARRATRVEAYVPRFTTHALVLALASLIPHAAGAQDDACASQLTADGKTIFAAARAANPTLPDLRETMVSVVKGLVAAGKVAPAGAHDNGAAAGRCMAAQLRATAPASPAPAAVGQRTGKLCGQRVEYGLSPPGSGLPADKSGFSGLWQGGVAYGATVEVCAGFVFERVWRDGAVGQYAWSTAEGYGIVGQVSQGVAKWGGQWQGDTLRSASPDGQDVWELRLTSPNEMNGFYSRSGNRRTVWLKRH